MLVMISLSYIFLSLSPCKKIALRRSLCAVGRYRYFIYYLGLAFLLFDESLSLMKIAGLITLVAGIVVDKIRYP